MMTRHFFQTLMVTGAAGFLGRHFIQYLLQISDSVEKIIAVDRNPADIMNNSDKVLWINCDITESKVVAEMFQKTKPDGIVHLIGGYSNLLEDSYLMNIHACQMLLSQACRLSKMPRILIVGSAAEYGTAQDHGTVNESYPLLAQTPYGISKMLQEKWALVYAEMSKLPVICTRPFNIVGPGQSNDLVPSSFLYQIDRIVKGQSEELCVGNTDKVRDFTDVRDVAAAFWKLMTADESVNGQVFNIASGKPLKIADIIQACIDLSGKNISVRTDSNRMKSNDVPIMVGDASKLIQYTGWQPSIDWRVSLKDTWNEIFSKADSTPKCN